MNSFNHEIALWLRGEECSNSEYLVIISTDSRFHEETSKRFAVLFEWTKNSAAHGFCFETQEETECRDNKSSLRRQRSVAPERKVVNSILYQLE